LLALNLGAGSTPALVAAGLALITGLCSAARLRPSLRNPHPDDLGDMPPVAQLK
jgi:DHA2 family multidrug resistance protein-like MFS transporter